MGSTDDRDIEKAVVVNPTEVHTTADSSTDRDGKNSSIDHEYDGARHFVSARNLSYWETMKENIWNIEGRGIARVLTEEKSLPRPFHDYFHMFSLWFSINLQAVNIIIGLLGPLVYGLGWVDCVCIAIFASALASAGISYLATFGPESGLRTMVSKNIIL